MTVTPPSQLLAPVLVTLDIVLTGHVLAPVLVTLDVVFDLLLLLFLWHVHPLSSDGFLDTVLTETLRLILSPKGPKHCQVSDSTSVSLPTRSVRCPSGIRRL